MSSSSSDEDATSIERFKEAAAEELINHMQNKDVKTSSKNESVKHKATKRNAKSSYEGQQYDLKSTPEFKIHVAKKLASYLDSMIDTTDKSTAQQHEKVDTSGGIRLLTSSKCELGNYPNEYKQHNTLQPQRKKPNYGSSSERSSSDDEEERKRLSFICVTGESILNGGEGAFEKNQNSSKPSRHNKETVGTCSLKKHKKHSKHSLPKANSDLDISQKKSKKS